MVAQILKAPLAQAQTALVNKYILWNAGICFTAKLLRKTAYGRKIWNFTEIGQSAAELLAKKRF